MSTIDINLERYAAFDESYLDVLDLPKDSTRRLCQLKLAQIEMETRNRLANMGEINTLEHNLREETERYSILKQITAKDVDQKSQKENRMLCHIRDAKYYKSQISESEFNRLDERGRELKELSRDNQVRRDELRRLHKQLEEFKNLEPTNAALEKKIGELKKSRLSLEMTFVEP